MAKKAATKDERHYMGLVANLGCALCRRHYSVFSPAEVHHARTGVGAGQRSSHYDTIPLCPVHHRLGNESLHVMGRKAFEARHQVSELDLRDETQRLLGYQP